MTGKLTKSQAKFANSLKQKKYRDSNRLFVVEGIKMVGEVLDSNIVVDTLVYTGDSESIPFELPFSGLQTSDRELGQISSLKTPNRVLALCKMPSSNAPLDFSKPIIALDGVSDPGNLGTIIRICDWFGFDQILCGDGTVDCYNPKVVQATMGSLFRVEIHYQNLSEAFAGRPENHPVFYADMGGEAIYETEIAPAFTMVMGSESHGVSAEIRRLGHSVSIPKYGSGESLNVAVSTGIICAEFKRKA